MFCEKSTPNENGFVLLLPLEIKYDEFAKLVSQHLIYDFQKLQFFHTSTYDLISPIKQLIEYKPDFQLKDAVNIANNRNKQFVRKLYYQKLDTKISELDKQHHNQTHHQKLTPNKKKTSTTKKTCSTRTRTNMSVSMMIRTMILLTPQLMKHQLKETILIIKL